PMPLDEDTPRNLFWGEYAKLKIAAEDELLRRHRDRGLPVTIVRPTHVYGPLNTRNNETFFFDRLVRGRPILVPGDGGWLRQFGHVEDLADAMAAMLGVPAAHGRAYNVTGEEIVTQVGFVALIADVMKRPVTLVRAPLPGLGYDTGAAPRYSPRIRAPRVIVEVASTPAEAAAHIAQTDVLYAWKFPPELYDKAARLRWLHGMGAGVEWALVPSLPT